ncbi:hypothetical protein [uncultured Chryseobacterium sp.]|uniref:hypothetical protein n=1 Tax=uncultured Chryseobacterium sp. TaxID=259322 RepID=UPI0025FA9DCA|nr:hypothetical protein [uncultured Chryseobacterium sp.]
MDIFNSILTIRLLWYTSSSNITNDEKAFYGNKIVKERNIDEKELHFISKNYQDK